MISAMRPPEAKPRNSHSSVDFCGICVKYIISKRKKGIAMISPQCERSFIGLYIYIHIFYGTYKNPYNNPYKKGRGSTVGGTLSASLIGFPTSLLKGYK